MRISMILAAAAVCIACAACSGKDSKVENNDIRGMWKINAESVDGGYIFRDNGNTDVYIYPQNTYFSDAGLFMFGSHIPVDNINYDGDIMKIDLLSDEIIVADRTDEPDKDRYNGEYLITGGSFRDTVLKSTGVPEESCADVKLYMDIEGERIRFTVKDIISYTFDGTTLDLKGNSGLPDSSGEAELSGDKLTIKRADGGERVMTRVKKG